VDCVGDVSPRGRLRRGVDAGRVSVAARGAPRDEGCFSDEEAALGGALGVVFGDYRMGGVGCVGAEARHGAHDDAVGEAGVAESDGVGEGRHFWVGDGYDALGQ